MIFSNIETAEPYIEAAIGTRFVNYLIDTVCTYLIIFVLVFGFSALISIIPENLEAVRSSLSIMLTSFMFFVIFGGYYVFFEAIFQRTPGKMITGTIVVTDSGDVPSFGKIIGRTLCRYIPFEPIIGLFGDFLHDTLPGTKVVEKSSLENN